MSNIKDNNLQENFISHFLSTAYANMEMEDEVHEPYDQQKLYTRYKPTLDALINEGIYKKVSFAHER